MFSQIRFRGDTLLDMNNDTHNADNIVESCEARVYAIIMDDTSSDALVTQMRSHDGDEDVIRTRVWFNDGTERMFETNIETNTVEEIA